MKQLLLVTILTSIALPTFAMQRSEEDKSKEARRAAKTARAQQQALAELAKLRAEIERKDAQIATLKETKSQLQAQQNQLHKNLAEKSHN